MPDMYDEEVDISFSLEWRYSMQWVDKNRMFYSKEYKTKQLSCHHKSAHRASLPYVVHVSCAPYWMSHYSPQIFSVRSREFDTLFSLYRPSYNGLLSYILFVWSEV